MRRPSHISTLRLPAAAIPRGRPEDVPAPTLVEALARAHAVREGHDVLRARAGERGVILDCYRDGELYRLRVWSTGTGEPVISELAALPPGLIPRED